MNTPPGMFRQYMLYLKQNGYHVIALRDVLPYYDWSHLPDDPLLKERVSSMRKNSRAELRRGVPALADTPCRTANCYFEYQPRLLR